MDQNNIDSIEKIKAVLSRVLLATAGFYNCTGNKDFITYIKLDEKGRELSLYVKDSACYMGLLDKSTGILTTKINESTLSNIKQSYIEAYITKLSRAEDYCMKHGNLPSLMKNTTIEQKWEKIISQMQVDKRPMPTKLADILHKDGTKVVTDFWNDAKLSNNQMISLQIVKDPNIEDIER